MARSRKYSPIFDARVVPAEDIAVLTAVNDVKYVRFQADVTFKGGEQRRNVMAFGSNYESVRAMLRKGRPVMLAVQHDNGTVKVIGPPRDRTERTAA